MPSNDHKYRREQVSAIVMRETETARTARDQWRMKCDVAEARVKQLEAALEEACNEYDEASQYKGDFLRKKHGDEQTLERLRAVLLKSTEQGEKT